MPDRSCAWKLRSAQAFGNDILCKRRVVNRAGFRYLALARPILPVDERAGEAERVDILRLNIPRPRPEVFLPWFSPSWDRANAAAGGCAIHNRQAISDGKTFVGRALRVTPTPARGAVIQMVRRMPNNSLAIALANARAAQRMPAQRSIDFRGIPIVIENEKGSTRSGVDEQGRAWQHRFAAPYGYIENTRDHDGMESDVFVGPNKYSNKAFIIDQFNPTTRDFDEHKCFVGFSTKQQILKTYRDSYGPVYGADHTIGAITEMSVNEFKQWLQRGNEPEPVEAELQRGGAVTSEGAAEPDHYRLSDHDLAALGGGDAELGHAALNAALPFVVNQRGIIPEWALVLLGGGNEALGRKVIDKFIAKAHAKHRHKAA